jgi:hypothetical protein
MDAKGVKRDPPQFQKEPLRVNSASEQLHKSGPAVPKLRQVDWPRKGRQPDPDSFIAIHKDTGCIPEVFLGAFESIAYISLR